MDFQKLRVDDLDESLSFYGYKDLFGMPIEEKVKLLEQIWEFNRDDPSITYPEPVVDLFIAENFQEEIPDIYSENAIKNLSYSEKQAFADAFGLDVNAPNFIDRLLRILDIIGALEKVNIQDTLNKALEIPFLDEVMYLCYKYGCDDQFWIDRWNKNFNEPFEQMPGFSAMETYLYRIYRIYKSTAADKYPNEEVHINGSKILDLMFEYGMEKLIREKFPEHYIESLLDEVIIHAYVNGHFGIIEYLNKLGRRPYRLNPIASNGRLDVLEYLYRQPRLKNMFKPTVDDYNISRRPLDLIQILYPVTERSNELFRLPLQPVLDWLIEHDLMVMTENSIQQAEERGLDTSKMQPNFVRH